MSTPILVLILEDQVADAELMLHELRQTGYDPTWQRVDTEPNYLAALKTNPDLILADWSLPQFSGGRALQIMRERGLDIPFIIVSGFISEEAAVEAMRKGAADYLLKDRLMRLGESVRLALEEKQLRVERRRAEKTLGESEKRFRALVEHSMEEISLVDSDGNLTWESPSARRPLGYPPDSFVGHNLFDLFHPDERAAATRLMEQVVEHPGSIQEGLFRLRHQDGSWRWMEALVTNLLDEPAVHSIVINYRDITERKQAEEALTETEHIYRQAITRAGGVPYQLNYGSESYVFLGEGLERLTGYLPAELTGPLFTSRLRKVESFGEQKDLSHEQRIRLAREGGIDEWREDYLFERKDGTLVWLADHSVQINDAAGNPNSSLGILMDITERKRAEETLRESEERFRRLMENAQDIIYRIHLQPTLEYEYISPAITAITGYTPEEHYADPGFGFKITHPDDRHLLEAALRGDNHTGKTLIIRLIRKDGGIIWTEQRNIPIFDEEGKMIAIEGISRDITERMQAEEALRDSEARYRALFQGTVDGILIADVESRMFRYANPAICRLLGYSEAELQTMGVSDIHPKADLPAVLAEFEAQASGDKTLAAAIPCLRKDGTIIYADVSAIAMSIDGQACNVGFFRDITERKQREEEIHSRNEELTTLYQLSRLLADAGDLEGMFELVTRDMVESVHTTFACLAMVEEGDLVMRAFYPVRVLEHEFRIGERQPLTALPICQQILDKNEPVILQAGSPEVGSAERQTLQLDFARSVCLVPLRVGDPAQDQNRALGLLILGEAREEKREAFTPEKIRLANGMGDQAAAAIRRMVLREQAGRRLQRLASLNEIDRMIASSFDLHVNLQMILKHACEQLEADAADVLVLNHRLQTLEFASGRGFHSPAFERKRLRLGEGQAGQAALERHIIQIPDVASSGAIFAQLGLLETENVAAYFAVPLITKGQVKGVLEIYQRTPLNPNAEWLDFLGTLAGQAAIAIDNIQMFDSLQRTTDELELAYDATIEGWSHALDLRDKETEGHTLRVTEMTVTLARTFGLGEGELVQVRWGGLLHDIGKMGVPDGILLKPGALTDEEWVAMKKHPTFAYEMLSPIHYLRLAVDIPYCHHEKWDGTGYPRGLKGEQIPLTARIFAVVDVWDALTSDRPYRKAWTHKKARKYILEQAGKQFDPKVVETFMKEELQS